MNSVFEIQFILFQQVPYIAVIISAILGMMIGAFWYSSYGFGKIWLKLMGWGEIGEEEWKKKQSEATPAYILSFIGLLIEAYAFSIIIIALQLTSISENLKLALLVWVGFIAFSTITEYAFAQKSKILWGINYGYQLVNLLLFAIVMSYFG
jgi:hypothetical protein